MLATMLGATPKPKPPKTPAPAPDPNDWVKAGSATRNGLDQPTQWGGGDKKSLLANALAVHLIDARQKLIAGATPDLAPLFTVASQYQKARRAAPPLGGAGFARLAAL